MIRAILYGGDPIHDGHLTVSFILNRILFIYFFLLGIKGRGKKTCRRAEATISVFIIQRLACCARCCAHFTQRPWHQWCGGGGKSFFYNASKENDYSPYSYRPDTLIQVPRKTYSIYKAFSNFNWGILFSFPTSIAYTS